MSESNKRKGLAFLAGTTLAMGLVGVVVVSVPVIAAQPLRRLPAPKHLTSEDVAEFK